MKVDILIEARDWDEVPLDRLVPTTCDAVLEDLGLDPKHFSLSFLACDDARIATLNTAFRGKPAPTNVLSWPAEDRSAATNGEMPHLPSPQPGGPPLELGDIAVAHETIRREAAEAGIPFDHHLTHLVAHGLLHLLGFDHIEEADAVLMERIETRVLARLGVPDPY